MDIGYVGFSFTWFNNCSNLAIVFGRLDRIGANQQWLILYKETRGDDLPIVSSEHGPLDLTIEPSNSIDKYPPFQVEAKWILQDAFM